MLKIAALFALLLAVGSEANRNCDSDLRDTVNTLVHTFYDSFDDPSTRRTVVKFNADKYLGIFEGVEIPSRADYERIIFETFTTEIKRKIKHIDYLCPDNGKLFVLDTGRVQIAPNNNWREYSHSMILNSTTAGFKKIYEIFRYTDN